MRYKILLLICTAFLLLAACGSTGEAEGLQTNDTKTAQSEETLESDSAETESEAAGAEASEQKTSESQAIPSVTEQVFAMDTYMSITCYGKECQEAADAAKEEIQRLDDAFSVGNPESEIAIINSQGSGTLSEDGLVMMDYAMQVYERSGGAFDITVYPLMELWGFTTGDFRVPEAEEIDAILTNMGSDKLIYDREAARLTLGDGQGVDLGGIAKGYTSGRLMKIFDNYDLVSAVISLGGNVHLYGTKPDGSLWKVGVQDPHYPEESRYLGILQASDVAVITSGAYERYFVDEETGETYHHILDPSTGRCASAGLISATVVSADGTLADTLSTACYVMGLEDTIQYWKDYGEDFELILMTEDDQVYITEGLEGRFSSDYPLNVIYR